MRWGRREWLATIAAMGGLGTRLLAAQTPATPARPRQVIDAHVHWFPAEFGALLENEGSAQGATVVRTRTGELNVKTPGSEYYSPNGTTLRRDMVDVAALVKAADERDVDVTVLTQTNPHVLWAPAPFGLKLARAINDATSALHRTYPKRFLGVITLPLQDIPLSLEELDRAAALPGMRAVNVTENIKGKNLNDKALWPLWERCEARGLPVFLHNLNPVRERLIEPEFSMMNVLGNPFEATIAATALVLGGVMDAFPRLDVYLPHAGGFFPFALPRIAWAQEIGTLKKLKEPASAYLRRFHYDLISHSPALTRTLIDLVGADRVVCGTDFPQPMAVNRPIDYLASVPGITSREAELILHGNAARLLKL